MPDKSFEQQVSEQLSDLRIKPDAAVWQIVAASLQHKRKRRWAIWLFGLLLGLSGAGSWLFIQQDDENLLSKTPVKQATESNSQKKTNTATEHQQQPLIISDPALSSIILQKKSKLISIQKNDMDKQKITYLTNNKSETINKHQFEPNKTPDPVLLKQTTITQETVKENVETATLFEVKKDSIATLWQTQSEDTSHIVVITRKESVDTLFDSKDSSDQFTTKKKESKWSWRADINLGISGVRNSVGSLFGSGSSNVYSNFLGNVLPTSPVTGPGSSAFLRPKIQDYFSAAANIEMIKKIGKTKRNSIAFQAGYQLYQTKTRIGSTNSGTIQFSNVNRTNESNVYFGVNDSAAYVNSYHFIRLGIQFYHSVNWLKKTNTRWYAGIGANGMISGNGLHLGQANNNIYFFKNRSLLRNIQIDIVSGLEMAFGKRKQNFVGPQVQYMVTNLSKQAGVNQHLFRPAVKLSFALSKSR